MPETITIRVEGLRELLRVVDQLPKQVKRDIRNELRHVAEPVSAEAQALFLARVSPKPRKTRYGITVRKAGSITVEQRVKGKNRAPRFRRPKFTDLVLARSLEPAVMHNERKVFAGMERVFDNLERRWAA